MQQNTRRHHGRGLLLALGVSASRAIAQTTSPFTDQATGAHLQRFVDTKTNFSFGIALPSAPDSNSFIGQLSFPLVDGAGWGGFSLSSDLNGPPLVACWPDGHGGVVSSFRQAFNGKENPPEAPGAFSIKPIPDGTSANNTFLTFTFLCEGCIDATETVSTANMAWALASQPVQSPESTAGVLAFPDTSFGDFLANLAAARSAEFDTWAAFAQPVSPPASGTQTSQDTAIGDLKARQTSGRTGNTGGQAFDTDTDNGFTDTDGIDSDSDDGRVRPTRAGGRVARRRRRATPSGGGLIARQNGSPTGGSREGFNTDTDGSNTDFGDGFDSQSDSDNDGLQRVSRRRRFVASSGRGLTARQTAGLASGGRAGGQTRGGFDTDTDGNNTDFSNAIDNQSDSDNGRRGTVRRTTRARGLAKRQTGGRGRAGFSTDTDNGTDFNSGPDSDSDIGVRGSTRVSRLLRSRRLAARQTGGQTRGGFNTDTDNSGNGTDLNSGLDSDSDNGRRVSVRVGRATARRAVGGGATIGSGLARRQTGGQGGATRGGGRDGSDTDSGNDSGNSISSINSVNSVNSVNSADSLDSGFSDFSDSD